MSALSSMASSSLSFGQMDSTAVIYSRLCICLGAIENLGPLAKTDLWPSVKLVLERFITHLLLLLSCDHELMLLLSTFFFYFLLALNCYY